jgi:hypothetical protein
LRRHDVWITHKSELAALAEAFISARTAAGFSHSVLIARWKHLHVLHSIEAANASASPFENRFVPTPERPRFSATQMIACVLSIGA